MTQHYSRFTVSAAHWCSKCKKTTQHRIDFVNELRSGGKLGPCLECIAKLDANYDAKQDAPKVEPIPEKQKSLWEDAS